MTSSSPIVWHRYTKHTIKWLCPSSSRCKKVRGQLQRDRGRTVGTMCTCEEIEGGTHACRVSKLRPVEQWWTQDGKLGITIQDPPPPRVQKTDTFIVFYLFVLHSVTCLKTCHFTACLTSLWTSISVFYVNAARDVVTVLLAFAKYLSLYIHIFTCTHRGTHTQARMYNQHTKGMARTRHKSLVERGGRKALLGTLHKKKMSGKTRYSRIYRKRFEHIKLSAKLLKKFLRSSKSNINQILFSFLQFDLHDCLITKSVWVVIIWMKTENGNNGFSKNNLGVTLNLIWLFVSMAVRNSHAPNILFFFKF